MQRLEQYIKKELAAQEQKKKQKSLAEVSEPLHAEPKTVQNKKEGPRPQQSEMILTESLSKMFLKNLKRNADKPIDVFEGEGE